MKKLSEFNQAVYNKTRQIPKGKITTYGEVARAIGRPQAYRAVGSALNKNPFAPAVPCHRVVKTGGLVGGFAHGQKRKIKLLASEGVKIENKRIIALEKIIYCFGG